MNPTMNNSDSINKPFLATNEIWFTIDGDDWDLEDFVSGAVSRGMVFNGRYGHSVTVSNNQL